MAVCLLVCLSVTLSVCVRVRECVVRTHMHEYDATKSTSTTKSMGRQAFPSQGTIVKREQGTREKDITQGLPADYTYGTRERER